MNVYKQLIRKHRPNCWRNRRMTSIRIILGKFGLLVLLIYLTLAETNHDLTYLVKRLGRVAVALLPISYFLTLRPSPLPQTLYLQLLPMHKILTRLVVLFVTLHAFIYVYIYYETNKLQKLFENCLMFRGLLHT